MLIVKYLKKSLLISSCFFSLSVAHAMEQKDGIPYPDPHPRFTPSLAPRIDRLIPSPAEIGTAKTLNSKYCTHFIQERNTSDIYESTVSCERKRRFAINL